MNVQIVDLTPEYIDGALDVFYESNLLHCSGAPDYFRKIPKEHSRPYLEWIIRNENTFGLVALADGKVAGIVLRQKKKNPTLCFFTKDIIKFMTLPSAKLSAGKKSDKDLTTPSKQEPKPTTLPILNWRSSASIPAPWLFIINWAIRKFHRL